MFDKIYALMESLMESLTCPFCKDVFSRKQRLESHLKRKVPCRIDVCGTITLSGKEIVLKPDNYTCNKCNGLFTAKESLTRHIKICQLPKATSDSNTEIKSNIKVEVKSDSATQSNPAAIKQIKKSIETAKTDFEAKFSEIKSELRDLKDNPRITQNILQVVCVGNNDNYLDMLANEFESFDKAITYIKNCALASVNGDCKLIEKIYFKQNGADAHIKYTDKSRTKIEYYDENKQKTVDSKASFGRRLANNLQSSYLKGVNFLITNSLENRNCSNKFLEDYDLQAWNAHIFDLLTDSHQRKIINGLNIPISTGS